MHLSLSLSHTHTHTHTLSLSLTVRVLIVERVTSLLSCRDTSVTPPIHDCSKQQNEVQVSHAPTCQLDDLLVLCERVTQLDRIAHRCCTNHAADSSAKGTSLMMWWTHTRV